MWRNFQVYVRGGAGRIAAVALPAILLVAAAISAADSAADADKADVQKLAGKWKIVQQYSGTYEVPKKSPEEDPWYVEIKGDQFSAKPITSIGDKPWHFSVDTRSTPHRIWIRSEDPKIAEIDGIYELDGDKLRIATRASNKPPSTNPSDFKPTDGVVVLGCEKAAAGQ